MITKTLLFVGLLSAAPLASAASVTDLARETAARAYACEAGEAAQVERLFGDVARDLGEPDLVVFNASARVRGPVAELDPVAVQRAIHVTCFGGFVSTTTSFSVLASSATATSSFSGTNCLLRASIKAGVCRVAGP